MPLDDLYREVIMDHYRRPRNTGRLENATVTIEMANPVCGDEIELNLAVDDNKVTDVKFAGQGCSISQSSASMMTEAIKGRDIDEVLELVERFKGMMRGEVETDAAQVGDLEALQGVSKFPVRIKCAILSWEALRKAIEDYRGVDGKPSEV